MPIPIVCPGCGLTENGPDVLKGKRVRCKRCKQGFLVGGGPTTAPPPRKAPARSAAPAALNFGEQEVLSPAARRRRNKGPASAALRLFLLGFLLGAGGVGYYIYENQTTPTADGSTTAKVEEAHFTWIVKSGADKPKDKESKPAP